MRPVPPIPRRELWLAGAAILLFCLIAATLALPAEEDAFIYYRYAWNWAHGHGLVFNTGDPVEGFSGPLWMGILALLAGAGFDLPRAATLLGLFCGTLALAATWALGRVAGLGPSGRLAAVFCVALSYPFIVWARSGLETPLYSLAIILTCAGYLAAEHSLDRRMDRRWPRRIAALAPVLVCLGRPEGAMLVVVMVVDRLTVRRPGSDWAGALRYGAPAAIGYGSYLVWRFLTFHSLVPNTSVKLYPLLIERSGGQFLDYVLFLGALPLLLPVLALLDRRGTGAERRRLGFLAAVVCLVSFLFNFLAGGDYRAGFRYFVPTLPVLIVAVWYACELLGRRGGTLRGLASVPGRLVLLALLLAGPMVRFAQNPPRLQGWRQEVYERWRDPATDTTNWGIKIARWMEEHVPEHSVVAYGQMGRIPYYLVRDGHDVRFVDTLGLVDREVARIYRFDGKLRDLLREIRSGRSPREALELGRRRRAEQLAETVLGKHPDFVLIEAALHDYPMMRALQENPEFQTAYHPSGQLPLEGLPYVRIYTPVRRRP